MSSTTMKTNNLICILLLPALLANTCKAQDDQAILAEIIGKTWWHSFEDDRNLSDKILPYRQEGFDFPRSRGREGFRMKTDSSFLYYAIAPTDGIEIKKGNWEVKNDKIVVYFKGKDKQVGFLLKVISLENRLLQVEKVSSDSALW